MPAHLKRRLWILMVGLITLPAEGCPPPRGSEEPSPGKGGTGGKPTGPPSICLLDVGQVVAAARKTPVYAAIWKQVESIKAQAQAQIDAMVKAYQKRFDLDIRAAVHIKKHKQLMNSKGVIHPSIWQQRLAKLTAQLAKDPALKRTVDEQRKNAPAYRARHLSAQNEAKRIAQQGAALQKRLHANAQKIAAPLAKRLKGVLESAMKEAVKSKRCDFLCNPITGKRLGYSRSGPQKGLVCSKGMTEGNDLTDMIRQKVAGALRATPAP